MEEQSKESYKQLNSEYSFLDIRGIEDLNDIKDPWMTKEQQKRDECISELLKLYVSSYKQKTRFIKISRWLVIITLVAALVAVFSSLVFITIRLSTASDKNTSENIVGIISSIVSFSALIVGLFRVITKYVFPSDDEKYITEIVSSIQSNDLENKREIIKASK